MRKLASIETITNVSKHINADNLDLVTVLGYQCVVPKNKYKTGDLIIYIKPDTSLPNDDWAINFKKYAPNRIKAIKLRGEWSEGLVVDSSILDIEICEGLDVTNLLKISKWEPPIPSNIDAIGYLPFNIPETDEERWENIIDNLPFGEKVDITLKVDGQSSSYYYNGVFGVLGRRLELKKDSINKYTYHINTLSIDNKLERFCKKYNVSLCLRGESYGKGIQTSKNNPHSQTNNHWKMFSVWNIKERKYEKKGEPFYFLNISNELELPTVDIVEKDVILTPEIIDKYSTKLTKLNGKMFEGVVVQHKNGSFKIINKYYDSKK